MTRTHEERVKSLWQQARYRGILLKLHEVEFLFVLFLAELEADGWQVVREEWAPNPELLKHCGLPYSPLHPQPSQPDTKDHQGDNESGPGEMESGDAQ